MNPGQYSPPAQFQSGPPSPRGRSRSGLIKSLAVIVAVAILATGAVVLNRAVVARFNGASSASGAVEDFFGALEDKDWMRLGLLLPPDETYQFVGLLSDSADLQSRTGVSSESIDDQLDGVEIDVSELSVSSEAIGDDLEKVTINRAKIVVNIDAKTVESVSGQVPDIGLESGAGIEITLSIDGPSIGYSVTGGDDRESGTEDLAIGGTEQAPFVMAVRRDGSWFVSPMFTAAQYLAEASGWEAVDAGPSEVTFDSPQAAADGFVDALIKTVEEADVTYVADAMGGVESRLLRTYAPGINAELGVDLGGQDRVEVSDTEYRVSPGENGQARITIERMRVRAGEGDAFGTVEFDDGCLTQVSPDGRDERGCISDGGEFGSRLYAALGHVVAVPADGGWKISPVATYFDWIGIVEKEIAGLDDDLLLALTQLDFSGIISREPAGTLGAGDEIVVDVEPVSDVLHVGIAVVEPEPSAGLVDFSCSADTEPGFCEVIVVDADGRMLTQNFDIDVYSGGYDSGYQYGYEVTSGTRIVVLSVAGRATVTSERW